MGLLKQFLIDRRFKSMHYEYFDRAAHAYRSIQLVNCGMRGELPQCTGKIQHFLQIHSQK